MGSEVVLRKTTTFDGSIFSIGEIERSIARCLFGHLLNSSQLVIGEYGERIPWALRDQLALAWLFAEPIDQHRKFLCEVRDLLFPRNNASLTIEYFIARFCNSVMQQDTVVVSECALASFDTRDVAAVIERELVELQIPFIDLLCVLACVLRDRLLAAGLIVRNDLDALQKVYGSRREKGGPDAS